MTATMMDTSDTLGVTDVFDALAILVEKDKLGEAGRKLQSFFAVFGAADKVAQEVTHEEQGISDIIHKALMSAKDNRLLRIAKERVKDVKRANYTKAVIDAFTGLARKVHEVLTTNEFVKGLVAKASAMVAANTTMAKNLAKKVGGLSGISGGENVVSADRPGSVRAASDTKIQPTH